MSPHNRPYAEISTFVHATEDETKVRTAISMIVSSKTNDRIQFNRVSMEGHYGNPILELKVRIYSRKDADKILLSILSKLSTLDEILIEQTLPNHFDEKNRFYLRLDKQQAFRSKISLSSTDTISLVFHLNFKPKSIDELQENLKQVVHGDTR